VPANDVLFRYQERLSTGLCRWYLLFVLVMCTAELSQTFSWKPTINFITETKYAYD